MRGRKKKLYGGLVACFLCLGAGIFGCEMATGNAGSGDAVTIGEMERSIVDLERKVSDLTREVAELSERAAKSEKALEAYFSGTARKPVEEDAVGGSPIPAGGDITRVPQDEAPANGAIVPETTTAPGDTTASAPEVTETAPKGPDAPADKIVSSPAKGGAKNPQSLYDRALSEIMDRKAETALPIFVEFVKTYPNDELTDNASYWIGECYYLMSDYPKALDQFRGVTERFSDKDKAPDAMLKMGYCYEKIGDKTSAREVYDKLVRTFPDSSAADLAREKMK